MDTKGLKLVQNGSDKSWTLEGGDSEVEVAKQREGNVEVEIFEALPRLGLKRLRSGRNAIKYFYILLHNVQGRDPPP